jgi:transcriptional regulator with XRE-family HTH domain
MDIINRKLKNARLTKGFTQDYMGEVIGVTQKQYSRIENGDSPLTITYLEKICKELDLSLQELSATEVKQENNNQSGGNAAYLIINEFSDKLIEQYENRLRDKDQEIQFLRSLLDAKK